MTLADGVEGTPAMQLMPTPESTQAASPGV